MAGKQGRQSKELRPVCHEIEGIYLRAVFVVLESITQVLAGKEGRHRC